MSKENRKNNGIDFTSENEMEENAMNKEYEKDMVKEAESIFDMMIYDPEMEEKVTGIDLVFPVTEAIDKFEDYSSNGVLAVPVSVNCVEDGQQGLVLLPGVEIDCKHLEDEIHSLRGFKVYPLIFDGGLCLAYRENIKNGEVTKAVWCNTYLVSSDKDADVYLLLSENGTAYELDDLIYFDYPDYSLPATLITNPKILKGRIKYIAQSLKLIKITRIQQNQIRIWIVYIRVRP